MTQLHRSVLWRTMSPEIIAELNITGLPAVCGISADDWLAAMAARTCRCRLVHDDCHIGRDITSARETGDHAANVLFTML